jgi:undecaprenyl-diphosphatase
MLHATHLHHLAAAAAATAPHHAAPVSYFQAVVLGLLQGVTELFPISSLGHTVLFPTLFGWTTLVKSQSDPESFWLAFVVMLHVGSAIGLLVYYWRDWIAIIGAWLNTLRTRTIRTSDERLAWLIITASIPTGILGLAFEHPVRVGLAKPMAAAIFLVVNGAMLLGAEVLRRRSDRRLAATGTETDVKGARPITSISYKEAATIGVAQSVGLIAGMSRDGAVMSYGLVRGLTYAAAARFSFLLATPIILAAGIFKIGDLTGPLGQGIRGQAIVAAACAAVAGFLSVAFLVRWFRTRTLWPFGLYCALFGISMISYLSVR